MSGFGTLYTAFLSTDFNSSYCVLKTEFQSDWIWLSGFRWFWNINRGSLQSTIQYYIWISSELVMLLFFTEQEICVHTHLMNQVWGETFCMLGHSACVNSRGSDSKMLLFFLSWKQIITVKVSYPENIFNRHLLTAKNGPI